MIVWTEFVKLTWTIDSELVLFCLRSSSRVLRVEPLILIILRVLEEELSWDAHPCIGCFLCTSWYWNTANSPLTACSVVFVAGTPAPGFLFISCRHVWLHEARCNGEKRIWQQLHHKAWGNNFIKLWLYIWGAFIRFPLQWHYNNGGP